MFLRRTNATKRAAADDGSSIVPSWEEPATWAVLDLRDAGTHAGKHKDHKASFATVSKERATVTPIRDGGRHRGAVQVRHLGDEVVLVDPELRVMRVLNGTAWAAWELYSEHGEIDRVVEQLAQRYETSVAVVRPSCVRAVEELRSAGLLTGEER